MELTVNGTRHVYEGDERLGLLSYLRLHLGLLTVKDGCSGQAACGACLVEVDGKAALACSTPMSRLHGKSVLTLDGFPETLKKTLAMAFVNRGAVQCGFCTPGFLTRTKILLQSNPDPSRAEVVKAVRPHLCRCTGYIPLVEAILDAARALREGKMPLSDTRTGIGSSWPKYGGLERALGTRPFADDLTERDFPGMVHSALVFSRHPRALIRAIHTAEAQTMSGVLRIFTAPDIPGRATTGMAVKDWPLYVPVGRITRYIGDVLALVVAESEAEARLAAAAVAVDYDVLPGLFDADEALAQSAVAEREGPDKALLVDPALGTNVLVDKRIKRGPDADGGDFDIEDKLAGCEHVARGTFTVPAVEHAFLEPETCVAVPFRDETGRRCLTVYDQAQGIWHDRDDIAAVLGLEPERVVVRLMDAGGGFGGKEDISVQAHASLAAWLLDRPVKVRLSRPESLRMHPKRHAMRLEYALGCDAQGKLVAASADIVADAGAYASVSAAVVTRTGTHATAAYHVPFVDIRVRAAYTNNIPAGAFRGFGVNQSNFAMESMMDILCEQAGLDAWQFCYDNAVEEGLMLTTGQVLTGGVGLKETLLAVRKAYAAHPRAGLACAVKNAGIGNGIPEPSDCIIRVDERGGIRIDHGWTEMGQGIHTVARQVLCHALNLDPDVPIEVVSSTDGGAYAGSTTASRGTFQLGMALLGAASHMAPALGVTFHGSPAAPSAGDEPVTTDHLRRVAGQSFTGHYDSRDQTSANLPPGVVRNHVSYSFATHVAFLDEAGRVEKILAAHDSGTVINRALYESQVTGGVAMGLGYALSEAMPLERGLLTSEKYGALGLLRSTDMPEVEVLAVEKPDPEGPLGAKGLGEISSIPSTAAVINALARFHGERCHDLPYNKKKRTE